MPGQVHSPGIWKADLQEFKIVGQVRDEYSRIHFTLLRKDPRLRFQA